MSPQNEWNSLDKYLNLLEKNDLISCQEVNGLKKEMVPMLPKGIPFDKIDFLQMFYRRKDFPHTDQDIIFVNHENML